jgi:hypothetical protein
VGGRKVHSVTRRSKKRSDLSQRQRSAVVGAGVVQIGLLVAAFADLWRWGKVAP